MRFSTSLSILVAACFACATPQETLVGSPPAEDETTPRTHRPAVSGLADTSLERPEPMLLVSGWPYQELGSSFRVTWDAPDTSLTVRARPSFAAQRQGEFQAHKDDMIGWRDTAVGIYTPGIFTARDNLILEGEKYDPQAYLDGSEYRRFEVGRGNQIRLFHNLGNGMCLVGFGIEVIESLCPDPNLYEGPFHTHPLRPADFVWWIQVETATASGWIALDDRVIVDIE